MKKELLLSPSKKKSTIEGFPSLKSCLVDIKGFNKVLLPVVKLDGSIVNDKWKGIPFTFFIQNVDVSRMDFHCEDNKYRLLAPVNLRKLDDDDFDTKHEYLQTSIDKVEKVEYSHVEQYSNNGLLMMSGSFNFSPNKRIAYHYDKINGTFFPVTKIVQYYLGNEEWLDSEIHTYQYDANGFLEEITMHQPACEIKMTEKILYKKSRKGFTAYKELAPHLLPAIDQKLGGRTTKIPFSGVFREQETSWDLDLNGWYIDSKKDENMIASLGILIHRHAFNHFYDINSGFLKYTCNIEKHDEITVKVHEMDGLPDSIEYTFSCPEENSKVALKYEKGTQKVKYGGYLIEHLGYEIRLEKEDKKGLGYLTLSGQYTLQQIVMMIATNSYLWRNDFEQKRISDRIMNPYNTNPSILNFIDTATKNGMERIVQEVTTEDNRTAGTLLGKPNWLQSNETPLDPDGKKMEFVAQLNHSDLFGTLYLFYSAKHQIVSQVFQCT
jgi:hypothetical protein